MTASHLFQDFGVPKPPRSPSKLGIEEVEDQKLQAFENGYQAGWDDAVAAQNETLSHVSSALASNLQTASFEYHELRSTLNATVADIMRQVTDTILPEIAQASLGAHVQDTVASLARQGLEREIEIVVSPESVTAVRGALGDEPDPPFVLITDDLLAPSQVLLRVAHKEIEVDLHRVVTELSVAISSFFDSQSSEVTDG